MKFDVIVIGAGAAGMMCAATAGARARSVLLIDHAAKLAEKIRISGGGRCNFTNRDLTPASFLSQNPHFCRSALSRYTPQHFIALVERHGIAYHEKTLGQLFCDDSSMQIIDMLKAECDAAGVRWQTPSAVTAVARTDEGFRVDTDDGPRECASLVVATGGLTVPKIGATPFGYRLAEQFGLAVVPPKPALVPLALDPAWLARFGELSGASFDSAASCHGPAFREQTLLTHRGLSGPAILQASSYWQQAGAREPVAIDLLPDVHDAEAWLHGARAGRQTLATLLADHLPKRFAQQWVDVEGAGSWNAALVELPRAALGDIARCLKGWLIQPAGTLGYNKAEVTLGGVDTRGLDQKTMAARAVPGLFFIGEVVDVTGWLGGYNFQWAWSSGWCAGQAV
ncbi:NAD(P)/FAD-dependent oxidoreductase [Methyloversatilis sp.]|uniref:NAD(P)/FAD-dependent oxidoreductase n=1 Tax=Methyloversatilis sp. TaxID=2569862 RepID=UPI0027370CB1|nr:NAD(P)/FAD-dependent oxidoreductase [Methyloversatilis sp.]MDP2869750.1 NAD(P)/FAD-dependent oxidoreductase [Methyloversatilis sp.]MDP3287038.1 NAD(P)/FAD-dependent oxidoreductase [Methyloversatilis sp.]MDP3454770.1 NAD(P)/FAD-dependent oxidoreductase [Methyloversatilis sp.]MDP3576396.1 NAD(P)/FAD-dependent oxidoreductase [Methyloversatilis sp.]